MTAPRGTYTRADPEPMFDLRLLGRFSLTGPGGRIELGSKKLFGLLAFIVCSAPGVQPREKLMTLLWGSHYDKQARHSLRQALGRLRRSIGPAALVSRDDGLGVQTGLFRCDATQFKAAMQVTAPFEARRAAIALYEGSFLSNNLAIQEEAWVHWVSDQRQELEVLALDGLVQLGEEEERRGSAGEALTFGNRAIAINEFREDAHRLVMRSLSAVGRRAEALKHFERLAARLKRDLNVEPDLATSALAAKLRQARFVQQRNELVETSGTSAPGQPAVDPGVIPPTALLPSIAVLPFEALGSDESKALSKGVVEDVVVSLARLGEFRVIAPPVSVNGEGQRVDARQIGKSLNARYVLHGNVRQDPVALRISTRLSDAETGASVWADRQEMPLTGDIFRTQDRAVERVITGLGPHVQAAELLRAKRTPPMNFTAYDHLLQAVDIINSLDRHTFQRALDHLNAAMTEQPGFSMPFAWAALWHSYAIGQGWADDPIRYGRRAASLASKAVSLDAHSALALTACGHIRSFLCHDYDTALVYFERALAACPDNALAWIFSSVTLSYVGRGVDAVRHAQRGLQLAQSTRSLFLCYVSLSLSHYSAGSYDEAVKWARMSVAENGIFSATHRYLAAALAANGALADAREAADSLLKLEPHFGLGAYARTLQPFRYPDIKARHLAHLAAAGLPT